MFSSPLTKTRTLATSLTAAALALIVGGCISGDEEVVSWENVETNHAITWEEFLEMTYQEEESGVYIVDGDIPIENIEQLYAFYEQHVQQGALIVNTNGGSDDKWSDSQKLNITYCVSQSSFGSDYNTVVSAMNSAAGAWENVANVDFVHVSSQDGDCGNRTKSVVFDVRRVNTNQYLARAFFPSTSRRNRNILIASSAIGGNNPSLTGVLRHELGHALGFRHEHTRPEAGVCFEDNSWRPLTPYDSASVMHYPQCNGSGNWSLNLTSNDAAGAASLYGAPGSGGGGGGGGGGNECNATGESCKNNGQCCSNSCSGQGKNKTCD